MADYTRTQQRGVPESMQTRYRDMGDGTHALVTAAYVTNDYIEDPGLAATRDGNGL